MGFNSAFKGLIAKPVYNYIYLHKYENVQGIYVIMFYGAAFPKPKIECPHNISVEIEPTQPTALVVFPQPSTDVDWFRSV
jgi:hypothetical protein